MKTRLVSVSEADMLVLIGAQASLSATLHHFGTRLDEVKTAIQPRMRNLEDFIRKVRNSPAESEIEPVEDVRTPMLNDRAAIIRLIEILRNSCTQQQGDNESLEQHEHKLFDNVDTKALEELLSKLEGE